MSWPFTFGTATSPVAAANLDNMFNQVGSGMALPCSCVGTNALSLQPLPGFPALTSYTELCGYRFRAQTNSTGPVTVQYNGLTLLPAYHADGATQVSTGDVIAGFEYVARFSQSLNSGAGGFFLESPAIPTAASTWLTPGGRLGNVVGTPVVFSSQGSGAVYYSPYIHPFCPIYNGTAMQTVQFTSSLSDANGINLNMGGAPATWPMNTGFDVFMTLISGVPTLCSIAWSSLTTRAVNLAVWGGVLTNNSATFAQTTAGTITLPVHQGTYLGSFMTHPTINGNVQWIFGTAASGGLLGLFQISNYYNKCYFTTQVSDTGGVYAYSGGARQARNSTNMAVQIFTGDSERAYLSTYSNWVTGVATGATMFTGIAVDATNGFNAFTEFQAYANGANSAGNFTTLINVMFGFHSINAVEQGDGINANLFAVNSYSRLTVGFWA
jgi:hypothetical protein